MPVGFFLQLSSVCSGIWQILGMFTDVCPVYEVQIIYCTQSSQGESRVGGFVHVSLPDNFMRSEYLPICSTSLLKVWKWTAFISSKLHSYLDYYWMLYCLGLNSATNDHSQKEDTRLDGPSVRLYQAISKFLAVSMLFRNCTGPLWLCHWTQIFIAPNFHSGSYSKVVSAGAMP